MIGSMSLGSHGGRRPDQSDPTVSEVVALELALLTPQVRADPGSVIGLLHEDFVEFGASGRTWDRAGIAAALAANAGGGTATVQDLRPVRLADDVILLTYRAVRPDRVTMRSSLWVQAAGRWRLLFHQGTACPDRT